LLDAVSNSDLRSKNDLIVGGFDSTGDAVGNERREKKKLLKENRLNVNQNVILSSLTLQRYASVEDFVG
jgi:hypothetical protein